MDKKTVIVIILGIAALVLSYYVYITSTHYLQGNVENILIDGRQKLNSSEFAKDFLKYNCTAIIMDVRGIKDPERKNIMQCGVDLAGSQGLVGKEMQVMGFDEKECVDENGGGKTVEECMQIVNKECYIFYITKGENVSNVYEGLLVIKEGDVYFPCRISYSVS